VIEAKDKVTVHATGIVKQTDKKFWSTKDAGMLERNFFADRPPFLPLFLLAERGDGVLRLAWQYFASLLACRCWFGYVTNVDWRRRNSIQATIVAVQACPNRSLLSWCVRAVGQQPFSYQAGVGGVIKGWDQGCLGMKIGETRK
jgi:hypothetical protein